MYADISKALAKEIELIKIRNVEDYRRLKEVSSLWLQIEIPTGSK